MLLTTTSKSKTNHHPIVYHTVQKNRPALTLISLTQFWSAKPAIIVPIYGLLYRSIRIEIGASYSNPTTRTIRVEAASHSLQMQFATTNTTTHRIHYKRRTLVRIVLRGSSSKSVSTTPHSCIHLSSSQLTKGCDLLHDRSLVVHEQRGKVSTPLRRRPCRTCPDSP